MGFDQEEGVDFNEAFSVMIKLATIQFLLWFYILTSSFISLIFQMHFFVDFLKKRVLWNNQRVLKILNTLSMSVGFISLFMD
jgi:hypothetical protein